MTETIVPARSSAPKATLLPLAILTLAAITTQATAQTVEAANDATRMQVPAAARLLPAPVGIGGAPVLPEGRFSLSYAARLVELDALLAGRHRVSPEWTVLNAPNPNAPPAQLRRVPISATNWTQAVTASYGVTDWLSINATLTYLNKSLETVTFAGMSGTRRLGVTNESTEGLGDSRIGVNIRLLNDGEDLLVAGLGLGLPTGSITETVRPLMPNGQIGYGRAGYMMQLGTGTYDLQPALTWLGTRGHFGLGAAYRGRIGLEKENGEGYRYGDMHLVSGWVSYRVLPFLATSARVQAISLGAINGRDPRMTGPGLGNDPANIGGERVEGFLGLTANGMVPGVGPGSLGVELGMPLYERANGVHLAGGWSLTLSAMLRF